MLCVFTIYVKISLLFQNGVFSFQALAQISPECCSEVPRWLSSLRSAD